MTDRMLDIKTVATMMGISHRTLRRWVRIGSSPIPFTRLGGKILRARESDVRNWMSHLNSPKSCCERRGRL